MKDKPRIFNGKWIEVASYQEAEDGGHFRGVPLKMAVLFDRVTSTEEDAPIMTSGDCYWVDRIK